MRYCESCLTTSNRPNSQFENGICIACNYSNSEKEELNGRGFWLAQLKEHLKKNGKKNSHNCIVGISGGKDSLRQALWVRDKLEMNPLLVCVSYPPKQMSKTGARNLENIIRHGFDLININPAPVTSMRLTKYCFKNFGNLCKATELALHAGVPKIAASKGIQNILWGENPALQVGDAAVLGNSPIDGSRHRNLNTLKEGGMDWMSCEEHKKFWYEYPSELEFERKKINIFYLGPIWEDWSSNYNATYSMLNGLNPSTLPTMDTGDITRASMLDEEYTNINMLLKYYKFGFGRATDYVNEEIRSGRMSREDAIKIVEVYDGQCSDAIIERFCQYIEISLDEFWDVVRKYTNRSIFNCEGKANRPERMFTVGKGL